MCQRAVIAMALASEPALLIADEPTTGLDATIQSEIVGLLAELKAEIGIATLLISHDIRVISRLADNVAVMYGGASWSTGRARRPGGAVRAQASVYNGTARVHTQRAERTGQGVSHRHRGRGAGRRRSPTGLPVLRPLQPVTDGVRDRCAQREPALQEIAPGHRIRCWLYAE